MIVVCAWCKGVLKIDRSQRKYFVDYGVCGNCEAKLRKKYRIIGPLYWDDVERIKNMFADKNLL